ncbi:MAG TPA: hypothetical protein VII72_18615 [Myxococcota bacterium]
MVAPSPDPGTRAAFALGFRTFQANHRPELVRSCGSILHRADGAKLGVPDVLRHALPDPLEDCARGKVAAIARRGSRAEVACYQVSDSRSDANLIACCNATAAAAAFEAERSGLRWLSLRVGLPGRNRVRVESWVGSQRAGGERPVGQIWHGVPLALRAETDAGGRHLAVCMSPLNRYLVLRVRAGEEVHEFPASEAQSLWRRFGLAREPLASRMAVVGGDANAPRVKFFTCGERAHPSAPPTGLAVLAIAAQRLGWEAVRAARRVITPAGEMEMPRFHLLADGSATFEFPTILVALDSAPAGGA